MQLLLEYPFEQDQKFLLLSFTRKSAMNVNPIDRVSQAQVFCPEVEQVLFDTGVFGLENGSSVSIHNRHGKLKSLFKPDELVFQPHQCLETIGLLVLLLRVFVASSGKLQKKSNYALFLFEIYVDLPHLAVFDEFLKLEKSLLEVGSDELNNF